MDHKWFKCRLKKLTRDRTGLQVSPFLVRKCVSYGLYFFSAKQQDGVFSFSTSND